MFLSRVKLNTEKRETIRALSLPHVIHGTIENSYADKSKRKLWRVDYLQGVSYLLVLSEEMPNFNSLVYQFGFPGEESACESKDYSPLVLRLSEGQRWNFRLRANPTKSSSKEKRELSGRGKVYAHITPLQQKQWLENKANKSGFLLDQEQFDVVHSQWYRFVKGNEGNRSVVLHTATFEGSLTVSNVETFEQALINGIGRAKAYGCGLLTIANLRNP